MFLATEGFRHEKPHNIEATEMPFREYTSESHRKTKAPQVFLATEVYGHEKPQNMSIEFCG